MCLKNLTVFGFESFAENVTASKCRAASRGSIADLTPGCRRRRWRAWSCGRFKARWRLGKMKNRRAFAGGLARDWLKDFWGRQKRILRHRRVNPLQNSKSVTCDIFVRVLHSCLAFKRQCDDLFQAVLRLFVRIHEINSSS